ncbi:MFS transporter [Hyphomicrobium sp. DY-1]|uniref:MFS transporter n=1 Tax=Hyphomicrobium sp. DY-1 TaxID=3075650 RepID=UPI0039C0298B
MNRRHWTVFAVCAAAFAFDALDFQIMALVGPAITKEWSLRPQELGFILSATGVGMLIGAYLFGILGDRIGRRLGFQITIAIFALSSGLCVFVQNPAQLVALRFITGIGIGGCIPIDTAMMSEYMPARRRGQLMAWFALFFPIGGLLAAAAARILVPEIGWRALFAVGVAPAILVLLVRLLIPESPRFLLARGRMSEAEKSIDWLTGGHFQKRSSSFSLPLSAIAPANFADLFGSTYFRRTVMLTGVWFFWAFSYFGLILWLPSILTRFKGIEPAGVFEYLIGFQCCGILGRVTMSFVVDQWGRIKTFALCATGAAVAAMVFGQQTSVIGTLVAGYILAFFHDGGQSGIAAYAPELYPTRVRTTGVGWANGAARIAAFLSPAIMGYLVPFGPWALFALLAAGYLLAGIVIVSFRIETAGLNLEDAALDADSQSHETVAVLP